MVHQALQFKTLFLGLHCADGDLQQTVVLKLRSKRYLVSAKRRKLRPEPKPDAGMHRGSLVILAG